MLNSVYQVADFSKYSKETSVVEFSKTRSSP